MCVYVCSDVCLCVAHTGMFLVLALSSVLTSTE